MRSRFALLVLAAMAGGILAGLILHGAVRQPVAVHAIADGLAVVTQVFLRLIRMVIAPLVLATLTVGVAHMEDGAAIGRVGARTLGWFIGASVVSLTLGLAMVSLLRPGAGMTMATPTPAPTGSADFSLAGFVTHLIPASIVQAMADNEILQIVIFAVLLGSAIAATEDRAPAILALAEQVARVMLKLTSMVMWAAPPAVFAALASTVMSQGPSVLARYAAFVGGFYLSLALLWLLMAVAGALALGRRVGALAAQVREPAVIAFSTASSEAAYPRLLEGLERFGVAPRIASFVLPLGYSFNLDGSMMYCTFAVMFIAQAYSVPLSLAQQVGLLLTLMVTSKGVAGVPRAAIVVVSAVLPIYHLPAAGLLLILAVDHLLDMGRSATNVIGNGLASVVVARLEGELAAPAGVDDPRG